MDGLLTAAMIGDAVAGKLSVEFAGRAKVRTDGSMSISPGLSVGFSGRSGLRKPGSMGVEAETMVPGWKPGRTSLEGTVRHVSDVLAVEAEVVRETPSWSVEDEESEEVWPESLR